MNRKVLIIDDDNSIRTILEIALEDTWDVKLASSGQEGINLALQIKPDLILLDRMMPGLDGLATLKELRANAETTKIPVIFLTAKVQTSDMQDYDDKDVVGVLSKPFDPMTIDDEIKDLLSKVNISLS